MITCATVVIVPPVGAFKDHFSGVAGNYAQFRPEYPPELFEWIGSVAPRRDCVWDCATGNGQAAMGLSAVFGEVIATDASAGQIENARSARNIQYRVAPAEQTDIEAASVDVITVAQAAHWFDLPKFYAEARRVLRPDGLLIVWCYGTFRFGHSEVDRLMDHFYKDVVGPYWPPERRYIEEDYKTLEFPLHELPTPDFHMKAEFTRERLLGYLRTWSATQRYIQARGIDPVVELESLLPREWEGEKSWEVSAWPIRIRAGKFG